MKIAEQYVSGLKKAYIANGASKAWDDFENIKHGISKSDVVKLKTEYPDIPESLISLLEYVDGTYWREYEGGKIVFYFLGSDIEEYPYSLLSAKQIIETKNEAFDYYGDYVDRDFGEDVPVDEKIIDNSNCMKWLHFSDCMNNGGTSQLFIDFSPSEKGVNGQIVRYLHDPDEIKVIAESFDKYLEMLINNNYDFINEDTIE